MGSKTISSDGKADHQLTWRTNESIQTSRGSGSFRREMNRIKILSRFILNKKQLPPPRSDSFACDTTAFLTW